MEPNMPRAGTAARRHARENLIAAVARYREGRTLDAADALAAAAEVQLVESLDPRSDGLRGEGNSTVGISHVYRDGKRVAIEYANRVVSFEVGYMGHHFRDDHARQCSHLGCHAYAEAPSADMACPVGGVMVAVTTHGNTAYGSAAPCDREWLDRRDPEATRHWSAPR